MERKYYKVSEVAEMFAMSPKKVREFCHAKNQNFAFQTVANGSIHINVEKFDSWFRCHYSKGGRR